jgi:hypothetical protein
MEIEPNLVGIKSIVSLEADLRWIQTYGNQIFNYTGTSTDSQYTVLLNRLKIALTALNNDLQTLNAQLPNN